MFGLDGWLKWLSRLAPEQNRCLTMSEHTMTGPSSFHGLTPSTCRSVTRMCLLQARGIWLVFFNDHLMNIMTNITGDIPPLGPLWSYRELPVPKISGNSCCVQNTEGCPCSSGGFTGYVLYFPGSRPGNKSLSEPMMVRLPTHICLTRPQWFNSDNLGRHGFTEEAAENEKQIGFSITQLLFIIGLQYLAWNSYLYSDEC